MTSIELVAADGVAFATGGAGYLYTFPAGPPTVGDLDVLCVNSDTVVATPAGFAAAPSVVSAMGAYIFRRQATGGEPADVTVTTTGNYNTTMVWSRWRNCGPADQAAYELAGSPAGTSTPAVSSGSLAARNELVIAFAALHGVPASGAAPTAPVWSTGYTPVAAGPFAGDPISGAGACTASFVAARVDAGLTAETPGVSWTDPVLDRYILLLTVTPDVSATVSPAGVSPAGTATALTLVAGTLDLVAVPGTVHTTAVPASLTAGVTDLTIVATAPAVTPAGTPAVTDLRPTVLPALTAAVTVQTLTAAVTVQTLTAAVTVH
jgi:hypothetical protein